MNQRHTRQHILEAAIKAIEKHGLQNLTTRLIAEEAGVNNAALHYYYGTKEHLVEEALALTLAHMLEDTSAILEASGSIRDRLTALFTYLAEGVLGFPNIIRAHLYGSLLNGRPGGDFPGMVDAWMERTSAELGEGLPPSRKEDVRIALYAAFTALLMTGLLPPRTGIGFDLRDGEARAHFIDLVVDGILRTAQREIP